MAATPDPIHEFLLKHVNKDTYAQYMNPTVASQGKWGKFMMFDCPIKDVDKYMALTMASVRYQSLMQPCGMICNEGGAIYGSLLACGYSPAEIVDIWATEKFNPIKEIESYQKVKGRFHKRSDGADHKGLHLHDALDALFRAKFPGMEETAQVTLGDLLAKKQVPFCVSVLDGAIGQPVIIGPATHPDVPLADAVLATCAVQPYIKAYEWTAPKKDPSDKSEKPMVHTYISASHLKTIPVVDAMNIYAALNINSQFSERLIGFTCNAAINDVSDTLDANRLFKSMNSYRAAPGPQIPPQYANCITIFQ